MFFIPIGDENPTGRVPYVNYMLIAINVILFLGLGFTVHYKDIVAHFGFIPAKAIPYTYITAIFLHGSIWHLVGNMLYLWIAGDNVEDKLGHIGYLIFYLLGGAVAAVFHKAMILPQMAYVPTIGASGAISAVLGAYIVLFPRNRIKFFYFLWIFVFIRMGTFSLPSFWAIGVWFLLQLFSHSSTHGYTSVAYGAHIGGFIFGVCVIGFLVLLGILKAYWHKPQDYLDIAKEKGEITYSSEDYHPDILDRGYSPYSRYYHEEDDPFL